VVFVTLDVHPEDLFGAVLRTHDAASTESSILFEDPLDQFELFLTGSVHGNRIIGPVKYFPKDNYKNRTCSRNPMGDIVVITGCMYAGKTAELQRRIRREMIAGRRVQLFKPVIDRRYANEEVVSHDRNAIAAIPVSSSAELVRFLSDPEVVGIDEVQFFDAGIVGVCLELARSGVTVICSALATDFRGEPFRFKDAATHIGELLAHAHVITLRAICTYRGEDGAICGRDAMMTQRLIDGKPAPRDSPLVLVGGAEAYEARCRDHHTVP
jgi:thymidine kinase